MRRQRRRVDRAAVGVRQAEADVVEQDDEDVGRILRQVVRLDAPLVLRLLQRRRRRRSPTAPAGTAARSRRPELKSRCPTAVAPAERRRRTVRRTPPEPVHRPDGGRRQSLRAARLAVFARRGLLCPSALLPVRWLHRGATFAGHYSCSPRIAGCRTRGLRTSRAATDLSNRPPGVASVLLTQLGDRELSRTPQQCEGSQHRAEPCPANVRLDRVLTLPLRHQAEGSRRFEVLVDVRDEHAILPAGRRGPGQQGLTEFPSLRDG